MKTNLSHRTYTSTAIRDNERWLATCDQHPEIYAEGRTLLQVTRRMQGELALVHASPAELVSIDVRPALPPPVIDHLERARELRDTATWANRASAVEIRQAAHLLAAERISLRDIGTILGVSHQRAHQLLHS